MRIHDWTRVDAGLFHHFHQNWVVAITYALNQRVLPKDYYALTERQAVGFAPDVLTLRTTETVEPDDAPAQAPGGNGTEETAEGGVLVAAPRVRVTAETNLEVYRRRQNVAAVRRSADDRLVAVVEVVSQGNKSGRKPFEDFVRKAAELLSRQVHLLILDLQPTTPRDPQGIHGAIWDEVAGEDYVRPADKPLTLAAYESNEGVRAFVEPVAIGDTLIDMPLFLSPGHYVAVPLDETYRVAFDSVPRRWRIVLEPA